MEYNTHDTNTAATRALTDSELDTVHGGTSQFIASLVATALNTLDPNAHCVAADHRVVCENPPSPK